MLRAGEGLPVLRGSTPARIFRRGSPPVEAAPGSTLEML